MNVVNVENDGEIMDLRIVYYLECLDVAVDAVLSLSVPIIIVISSPLVVMPNQILVRHC